jgi:hypothetical protein
MKYQRYDGRTDRRAQQRRAAERKMPMRDSGTVTRLDDDTMNRPDRMAHKRLLNILAGPLIAQACFAMCRLGVPGLLAGGPRTAAELAAGCGADPKALRRLLAALTAAGLLRETMPGTFGLTATGDLLRSDSPASADSSVLLYGQEIFRSLSEIMYTVRTGKPAFDHVYGTSFYTYLDQHPEVDRRFGAAQGSLAVPAILATCDLSGVGTLVDIGGGNGRLLGQILTSHPAMRAVLVERPEMVRQATDHLGSLGVLSRVDLAQGDFFDAVPAGADAYVLSRCLHNWDDDRAAAILRTVRRAMAPASRLLVFEEFVGEGPGPERDGAGGPAGSTRIVDLLMLIMMEGHDRSEREYRALLATAGFEVLAVRPGRHTEGVIEARAA